ncbi:MAG: peptidoglycan DD-metalloendopeptidase family protein [Paludibacter sp.]|nr:peptidoglycan DD-metalloendopeptidase family protein [Paludibacter sp.]
MHFQPFFRIFVLILTFSTVTFSLHSQSVKELETQRKQTLEKLETTSKLLNENKKSKLSTLNKLNILTKNIKQRKVLINTINTEINQLDVEMKKLDAEKQMLENRLKTLKTDYAKLVQEAHINRDLYAKIMFVLSAKSFDQSYRRLRYLQEYTDYRKQQVREIEKVTAEIAVKNENLKQHKSTKVTVVTLKETEAKILTKDEQKQKVLLTGLQKKEKSLRADLKIQQKKARDLNNKIERIIAEEIRKAEAKRAAEEKKRLAAESKTKTSSKSTAKTDSKKSSSTKPDNSVANSSTSVSVLTKEETLLSGNFERNIGRLPWPTSNGFISGHYGIQAHPVLKHVTTNNKGVYIQTPSGSSARAVYDGVVTQRFSIPGSNNAVIIQHGNYRTVYANLTQIYVSEGDHVSAKQSIGKIYTDDEKENKTELYFQVWKGRSLQNPESWITR